MQEHELITVPKYASANRMTLYKVLQQVRSGELESVVKEIEGKEVTLIVHRQSEVSGEKKVDEKPESVSDYKKAYETLLVEYRELKEKYDTLLKQRG